MGASGKGRLSSCPASFSGCIPKSCLAGSLQGGPSNLLSSMLLLVFIFYDA